MSLSTPTEVEIKDNNSSTKHRWNYSFTVLIEPTKGHKNTQSTFPFLTVTNVATLSILSSLQSVSFQRINKSKSSVGRT